MIISPIIIAFCCHEALKLNFQARLQSSTDCYLGSMNALSALWGVVCSVLCTSCLCQLCNAMEMRVLQIIKEMYAFLQRTRGLTVRARMKLWKWNLQKWSCLRWKSLSGQQWNLTHSMASQINTALWTCSPKLHPDILSLLLLAPRWPSLSPYSFCLRTICQTLWQSTMRDKY